MSLVWQDITDAEIAAKKPTTDALWKKVQNDLNYIKQGLGLTVNADNTVSFSHPVRFLGTLTEDGISFAVQVATGTHIKLSTAGSGLNRSISLQGSWITLQNLNVGGNKNKVVEIGGEQFQFGAIEMLNYMKLCDEGEAKIGRCGYTKIKFNEIFVAATMNDRFIQIFSKGLLPCKVIAYNEHEFIIIGFPGRTFRWEVSARAKEEA